MMKHKITILLICLSGFQFVFGQDGLLNKEYFILQKDKKSISVNKYRNNEIIEISNYSLSDSSLFATDGLSKVVILDIKKKQLRLYDFISKTDNQLKIPFKIKPLTIFINSNNILIGGETGNETMIQWNFEKKEWFTLDIPTDIIFPGKAIDDIVISNDTIYAVDNIVLPKYILLYLDNKNDKCSYISKIDLKSNGAYESIRQARITSKYLGLISDTYSGWVGEGYHITVYDRNDFSKSFAISIDREDAYSISDFLIVDNELIILSKEKGVGRFTIRNSDFKKDKNYPDSNFNVRVNDRKINFNRYKDKEIISLTIIPNSTKIILTERRSIGKYNYEIIE